MKAFVLILDVENVPLSYSAPEAAKVVRDAKHALCLEPLSSFKYFDVPLAMLRQHKKPLAEKDAFLVSEFACQRLKLPAASFEGEAIPEKIG